MKKTFSSLFKVFAKSSTSGPSKLTVSSRVFATMHKSPAAMLNRPIADDVDTSIHQPRDPNTLSNYNVWRTKHVTADLELEFAKNRCVGTIKLELERLEKGQGSGKKSSSLARKPSGTLERDLSLMGVPLPSRSQMNTQETPRSRLPWPQLTSAPLCNG